MNPTTTTPLKIALLGAGGKMGCRISDNMIGETGYQMLNVEVSPQGIANLEERRLSVVSQEEAMKDADAVILALPDKLIGKISPSVIPQLKSGARVISLDPAAAYAEVIPLRDDLTYFVSHPCHPPLFEYEPNQEAHVDWFGGKAAKQSIVNALHQGPEEDYAICEGIAKAMFKPILRSHRISVEQMAILEPAVVETTTASLIYGCREALEEGIKMGVPKEAAWDFVLGHLRTELAIIFDMAGFPFSDGAKHAIAKAQESIFLPDWKERIFNRDAIKRSVKEITDSI